MSDLDWKNEALCTKTGHPDDWFNAEAQISGEVIRSRFEHVAAICAECPVRETCLETAIENRETWGVWGGMSTADRERLIDQSRNGPTRRPIIHGIEAGFYAHKRRGEDPCDDCREALNAADQRRRQRRKDTAA